LFQQREQLANELISGEEQKKIKLDKRRAKKKLRREKKRIEKEKTVAAAEAQKKVTVRNHFWCLLINVFYYLNLIP